MKYPFYTLLILMLSSCANYKANIMFKPEENFVPAQLQKNSQQTEHNYVIQKNDYLTLQVFSNSGEKLIDPNPELTDQVQTTKKETTEDKYLVDLNGVVKFPMIGELKLDGLTLRQAEQIVQKEFEKFYKSPFVKLTFDNKRVIVLGAPGGKVIPLRNENVTLAEVLALATGVNNDGKAHNIRVIRGEQVFLVDFSSIEGYKKGNMIIEHGDIVYVEPVRKPLAEGFRDYGIILTFVVSFATLISIFTKL